MGQVIPIEIMNDEMLGKALSTVLAFIMLPILFIAFQLIKKDFRSILIKVGLVNPNETRSYSQRIGYSLGKTIARTICKR